MKAPRKFAVLFCLTIGLALLWSQMASAQLRPGQKGQSQGPISISADSLEAENQAEGQKGLVTFKGAVLARQGDLSISCDLMKVFYSASSAPQEPSAPPREAAPSPGEEAVSRPEKAGADQPLNPLAPDASQQIERVECEGNVRIVEGDRLAVGDKALYLAQSLPRRIILTGDARVWQGADSVTGHEVTYFLDQGRSTVEGQPASRERVRATYQQEKEKNNGAPTEEPRP